MARGWRTLFEGSAVSDAAANLLAFSFKYTIRLKANSILQESIAYLLTLIVGRPPNHVVRTHASFSYQAGSWDKSGRMRAYWTIKDHP